jgi:LacI family transcriptional regulator
MSGVSISTISRVLNNPDMVKMSTRRKVFEAIDELGFVPKAEARAHAMRQTNRIGVITPYFTAPSFVQRLRGVAGALSSANYEVAIFAIDSVERLHGYLASLPLTRNLDGLVIISAQVEESEVDRLLEHGLQTVLIEYPHPRLNSIEINDFEGGRLAAEYLLHKGHRRIAFIGDTDDPTFGIDPITQRLRGFRQAMLDADAPVPAEYVHLARYSQEQMQYPAGELLQLPERPTAIFAATDFQALSVIKVARNLGLSIPGDLAVIGFDDLDLADYVDLTTVSQHLDESGQVAVEILLASIEDPSRPPQHVTLPLSIVERATA